MYKAEHTEVKALPTTEAVAGAVAEVSVGVGSGARAGAVCPLHCSAQHGC